MKRPASCGAYFFAACLFCAAIASAQAQSVPIFSGTFSNSVLFNATPVPTNYAPNMTYSPVLAPTGPADATNATFLAVLFLSNSAGNTNLSDATAQTGFALNGASTNAISGMVSPPVNPNTNNLYYSAQAYYTNSPSSAWLGVNFVPGTNTAAVTNYLQVVAVNGQNNQSANWATTNLAIVVRPKQASPPHLEIRFYNSSTNSPSNVYVLPQSGSTAFGNGFWWSNATATNNWTNYIYTTTNMAVRLSDIGVSGTNSEGKPYYAVYTTNFPSAAWYLGYGGGALAPYTNSFGQWDGVTFSGVGQGLARPNAGSTSAPWFGAEWNPFELTLDGNAADKSDTTYINQFSIPMVIRALTNTYENAAAGIFPTNSSAYYQLGGWTNGSDPAALALALSNLVQQLTNAFPKAVITNASGVPVMVAGPSSASFGTLVAPQYSSPPYLGDAQNAFPRFTAYFDTIKANTGTTNRIKDWVGLAGASGPDYSFWYDFKLTVTSSNSLRLEGSMAATNSTNSSISFSETGLVLEVGGDQGANDNWASSTVYLAQTPANFTVIRNLYSLSTGAIDGLYTNVLAYSPYASNGLGGASVSIAGSNLAGAVQVAFSGPGNSVVPCISFWATNSTNITAIVPFGAVTGPVIVTTTNGSAASTNNFAVTGYGGAPQSPSVPAAGAGAPVITGLAPTNGAAASPVLSSGGGWMALATNTQTGPTNASPSTADLYNSGFGSAVMGRIMGDMAAGISLGFVGGTASNPATGTTYGDSPSGSWWGGNEFPAGNSNSLAFSQVNTTYSQWGNFIHSASAVTYSHPIYDRMQYYAGTNPLQIQPACSTNNNPDIWVIELEFFDGMSSVSSAPQPSGFLSYSNWLTNYPSVTGTNNNTLADPDGDAFANIVEYAFDGDPSVDSPAMLSASNGAGGALFRYVALKGAGTNYAVQGTLDLVVGPWTNAAIAPTNAADQSGLLLPASYERKEFFVPYTGTNGFYRVTFTNQ